MKTLIFHKRNQPLFKCPITKNRLTIGRDPSCDIVLTEAGVSRVHCEIVSKDDIVTIKDSSRLGIFVNGKKTDAHNILCDDKLELGDWVITLNPSSPSEEETVIPGRSDSTKILGIPNNNDPIRPEESLEMIIKQQNGTTVKKQLHKKNLTIGSASSNDIVLGDDYVSKKHAKISFENDDFFITDLGSTNGIYYEGERFRKLLLPSSASLMIGKTEVRIRRISEEVTERRAPRLSGIYGVSKPIKEIVNLVKKVARTDATVLISGESGTGKELIARAIHDEGARCKGPFLAINCGAIPQNIIESELFGHEKGAFTGAAQIHNGVFEQANGGTLFLDEIGEMPIDMQTRLLRVLECGTIRRIGGLRDISVNVRIIAATNQDLKKAIRFGKFREDLFFRLYIVPIHLPPLRDRKNDIAVLAEHFVSMFAVSDDGIEISPSAMEILTNHSWSGNVRELKNTIQRAVILNRTGTISAADISLTEFENERNVRELPLTGQEKEAIEDALRRYRGNQSKAANLLGIARGTLANKISRYKIDANFFKPN